MASDRTLESTLENTLENTLANTLEITRRTCWSAPTSKLAINTMSYLFPTATNVAPCHFSRGFPRTWGQRTLTTSLTRLLDDSIWKPKCGFKSPWVFHQAPSSTRHLHQCFRKCLTRQSSVWSGSAVPWKHNVDTKLCKKTVLPCLKATFQAWRREASSEVHTGLLPLRLSR